jgi:Transposase DDE domain group 1
MRGNTHVRFGGAGRGDGTPERTPPRPGPIPTNLELPTVETDQFHRDHATVELAIRDLKAGAGLEHCPSGRFFANAAWLACAVLAHNIVRWTTRLGDLHPAEQLTVARTIRTQLIAMPGRLVNHSRRWVLRLPARWPWATSFHTALDQIRSLPLLV